MEAAATVLASSSRGFIGSYLVENLSTGGALLSGGSKLANERRISLLLQLPGRKPLHISAEIVRHEKRGPGDHLFGVAFRQMPPSVVRGLQRAVYSLLERTRISTCLLVAAEPSEFRRGLAQKLASMGRRTRTVDTPVDMVVHLQDANEPFEAALVDLQFGRTGMDVIAFLQDEYPEIRRVLISKQNSMAQLERALHHGQVNAILPMPFEHQQLVDALTPRPALGQPIHFADALLASKLILPTVDYTDHD